MNLREDVLFDIEFCWNKAGLIIKLGYKPPVGGLTRPQISNPITEW